MVLSSNFGFVLRLEESDLRPGRPVKAFEKRFPERHAVRLHYHESLELNLSRNVQGYARIGREDYDLSDHPLLVLAPRSLHSYAIEPSPGSMLILHINPSFLGPWIRSDTFARSIARLPPASPAYAAAEASLRDLSMSVGVGTGDEARSAINAANSSAACAAACALEARILAVCALLLEAETAAVAPTPDDPDLRHLISWSEERVAAPPPVSKAAKEMGMSRSAFCRWFSARTGMGYAAYLEELRMEVAREYLVSGFSVSEAASRLGYGDCSYFVRRFRLRYGVTPGAAARVNTQEGK